MSEEKAVVQAAALADNFAEQNRTEQNRTEQNRTEQNSQLYTTHNRLIEFIWNIADVSLRDVYVRGKYRDVILPMVVLRRLDILLEPTKDAVLAESTKQYELFNEINDQGAMYQASGRNFYNTSKWTLQTIYESATNSSQNLLTNTLDYLNKFSPNVQNILSRFKLQEQIEHMIDKGVFLSVLEQFLSPQINLSNEDKEDENGHKLPKLTNLGMGYVFEELIRRFNEDNNEEAGEHFTPREVIELMVHLVFDPIQNHSLPAVELYDPACGSGGMLTEAANFIADKYSNLSKSEIYSYGCEINDETWAICTADMLIKGDDPTNIKNGSTLEKDHFDGKKFNFMFSNPPYGKNWTKDVANIKDKNGEIIDKRFEVTLDNYWGTAETVDATPRTSDGQLLFLMEMVKRMKSLEESGQVGSRVVSVHNGSALFTGDAGSGESNIRRYLIEQDLLDAIVQLPNNLFYNTGITTYIWLLSNNKPAHRKGKVQLIDANNFYRKLRKNLGQKNCEFSFEQITDIVQTYLAHQDVESEQLASKIFDNQDFGYYKVTIERPDRRVAEITTENIQPLRFDKGLIEPMQALYERYGDQLYQADFFTQKENKDALAAWYQEQKLDLAKKMKDKLFSADLWQKGKNLLDVAEKLQKVIPDRYTNFNVFKKEVEKQLKAGKHKLSASEKNAFFNAVSRYDETAEKVIAETVQFSDEKLAELLERFGCQKADLADFGYFATEKPNEFILYATNTDLRDSETIPLKQTIHHYFQTEVKPHSPESWINLETVKIGYEISFNKYFYRYQPLRPLDEIKQAILQLESESDGIIAQILSDE